MKKTAILFFAAITLGFASCDMDKLPYNKVSDQEALQTVTDFKNMRVGLYSAMRSITSGGILTAIELQADNFNAVVGYSNTYGDMYRWQFTANTSTINTVYGNYQALIGRANYIITNQTQADSTQFELADQIMVKKIIGEAYFMRAYSIYQLSQYFCKAYNAQTASEPQSGVSYRTDYAPSSNPSTYPARYTLEETYAQIAADIEEAKSRINVDGEPASGYVTNDIITALEARVALSKGDYSTAAEKAASLVDSGRYPLVADGYELMDMWTNDGSSETIWQIPIPSLNERPGQNGRYYLPYQDGAIPDYIPTAEFINLFEENDARLDAYFLSDNISTTNGASGTVAEFNKFPDESGLWQTLGRTEDVRFTSEPKVFRIAEMYLIATEAYAQLDNLESATHYLNALKASRIAGYTDTHFASTSNLLSELKNERRRELAGEGFRMFDLKRWGEGVKRGEPQNMNFCLFPGSDATTALSRSAADTRMVWPIPQSERDTNPQIAQNPGY